MVSLAKIEEPETETTALKKPAITQASSTMTVDVKNALLKMIEESSNQVAFAYPSNNFAEHRAHACLQSIKAVNIAMEALLTSIK